jgi:hypothetical protein
MGLDQARYVTGRSNGGSLLVNDNIGVAKTLYDAENAPTPSARQDARMAFLKTVTDKVDGILTGLSPDWPDNVVGVRPDLATFQPASPGFWFAHGIEDRVYQVCAFAIVEVFTTSSETWREPAVLIGEQRWHPIPIGGLTTRRDGEQVISESRAVRAPRSPR